MPAPGAPQRAPDKLRLRRDGQIVMNNGGDVQQYLLKTFGDFGVEIPIVIVHRDSYEHLLFMRLLNTSA